MSITEQLLAPFGSVSLEDTEAVKLLNRVDAKYVFHVRQLIPILKQLQDHYQALEIGGIRLQRYQTLYFDTPGKLMYLHHHNGRQNRYKVRSRKYLDTGVCYFEIKFKNNRGRTVKKRILHEGPQEIISGKTEMLLTSLTRFTPEMLRPALWVNYSRITLVNPDRTERITIDTGLQYRQNEKESDYPDLIIAELKQEKTAGSLFERILHQNHITGTNISKYCLGTITLDHHIKQNRFKEKLILINKLNHDNH